MIKNLKVKILIIVVSFSFIACTQQSENTNQLKQQINSLEEQLEESYHPGFGEFMSSIQAHHCKLYFAGQNQNWELADFEVQEIKESLEDISEYCKDREESKSIAMIQPAIDSVNRAITQKSLALFNSSFNVLTNSCNSCHQATNFGFNVVKIPEAIPFSNQDFTAKGDK
jgi:molecular chaperone GrpE (heat shock protein)